MSLKKKGIAGIKWSALASLSLAFIQLIKISLLVRVLDKSDFGLLAIIVFVLNFLNLFTDMGLSAAILHKRNITKEQYSSLYWINIIFSVFLFLLLFISVEFIADFYKIKELNQLLPIAGLAIIFSAIGKQHKTILQKNLNFKLIAVIEIGTALFSLVFAVYLAFTGAGIYSLILSTLVQIFLSNVLFLALNYRYNKLSFILKFSDIKDFLKIGGFQTGGQFVNYFNRDVDILIVGKLFSPDILGGYNLAKQLVFRPVQIINPILTRVAPSLLSKIQDNNKELSAGYLKVVNAVSSFNIPVYIFIIIFAPQLIYILYGSGFESIVTVVRILSIYMIFRSIINPIGSLVIATGRTDLEFYWNFISLLVMPLAVWVGSFYGINGVAFGILISWIILFFPSWYFLIWKMVKIPFKDYIKAMVPDFYYYYRLINK